MAYEAEMIHNIFEYGEKEAKDIMTHRKNIVAKVVYHHVHERKAAERVNQPVAVRIILFHIS